MAGSTLSYRGVLTAGVYAQLRQLGEKLDVHVLSADTRGTAREQLHDLPSRLHILTGSDHDVQRRDLAKQFDLRQVVAFGNGQNDRLLSLQGGDLMSKGENLQLQVRYFESTRETTTKIELQAWGQKPKTATRGSSIISSTTAFSVGTGSHKPTASCFDDIT